MSTHSNILAWRIPWTEKPCRLQSMGLQSRTLISMHLHAYWEEGCVYLIHTKTSSELPGDLPSFWEFLEIHTRWKEQRSFHSIVWTNYSLRMCFVLFPTALLLMIFSLLGMPLPHLFPYSSPWLSDQRQPPSLS